MCSAEFCLQLKDLNIFKSTSIELWILKKSRYGKFHCCRGYETTSIAMHENGLNGACPLAFRLNLNGKVIL